MKKKIIYPIVYGVLVLLLILATFCDLSISKALASVPKNEYFSNNFFANFFECFGEIPVFLILGASVWVVGYNLAYKKENYKTIIFIITGVLSFFVFCLCLMRCIEALGEVYDFTNDLDSSIGDEICIILFSLVCIAICILLTLNLGKEKFEKVFLFCLTFVIIALASFLITQILKAIFSRPRFRALSEIGYRYYSPWYKPSTIDPSKFNYANIIVDDGFVSFPSGHTSWITCSLTLAFLPRFINISKKAQLYFTIIPAVFTILVAFSRIIAGAHFLSDVVFSLIFTLLLEELTVFVVLKLKNRKGKKNKEIEEVKE